VSDGGLNPEFENRIMSMIGASGGLLKPGSGFRTVEQQIALRRSNGCPDVWRSPASACRIPTAIPGRSNHNHGLAMDLVDASTGRAVQAGSQADKWLRANAGRYGLHQAVKGEAWHVEMIDDENSRAHIDAAGRRGALGFDVSWMDEERTPQDELAYRLQAIQQAMTEPVETEAVGEDAALQNTMATPELPTDMGLGTDTTVVEAEGDQAAVPAGGGAPAGKGVDRWRGLVAEALRYVGEDPSEANIALTLRRMQQESGGDPGIVNDWDSNAKRGTPSIGLMQVILPTFNTHAAELRDRGQRDPFANLVASMRYAKKRYGSLAAAYGRKGGY
jgi:hypothetical protein